MTRQEVWKKIQELGGRDEFILHEMKRLGFWDTSSGIPQLSEELREKRKVLQKELNEELRKQEVYRNKKKLLREMRKQRMAEAKQKRIETKEKRKKEKEEKAAAHKANLELDIKWLGPGVSAGLQHTESKTLQLATNGLPVFAGVAELADQMKLKMNELRFLAFDRQVSKISHYKRFKVAKKTGGFREISAPAPRLKSAQHWILENILLKVPLHNAAHGFVNQRSIVSNALPHLGAGVVINLDVKDFFPSISYKRVKGVFMALGYSEQLSTIFALLCTEPQTDQVKLDGQDYFVSKGVRRLPQGAPTSPAITNILCMGMDRRFQGMADALGWAYTRYADDLTFSKKGNTSVDVSRILWQTRQIIEAEGFVLHPDKIKVMRKGSRQEVTGVVVNEKLNIPRAKRKQFRAVLHRIETQGIQAAKFGQGNILESIQGFANYALMVNPVVGASFKKQVQEILAKPALQAIKAATDQKRIIHAEKAPVIPAKDRTTSGVEWWRLW